MARISDISIKQQPGHYTLTIRKTIDFMQEYAAFAEDALRQTGDYLQQLGLNPISGPIACFHNTALEALDVEMGWQIIRPVENAGNMICTGIPARKVVSAIDLGPYEAQDPTLIDIMGWIEENKVAAQGPICYCYLNDTNRPAAEYLTQMIIPV